MSKDRSQSLYSRIAFVDKAKDDRHDEGLLLLTCFKNEFYISWVGEPDARSPLHDGMLSPGQWQDNIGVFGQ
jgi:hypothetical protein